MYKCTRIVLAITSGPGFFSRMVLAVVSGTVLSHGTEIHVDAGNVVNASSPLIYGACIEDVNHEIYGGLYGQRLYGESFEEPAPPIRLAGWTTCGGDWLPAASSISTTANSGAKIVREQPPFLDGTLEFDIRFTGTTSSSNNAGALVRVRNPGTGADAFDGYEISLASNGTSILLGRHQQDWKLLKSAAVAVDSSQWQHLSVVLAGARIQVFLNAASSPAIDCVDAVGLPAGTLGLRTWGANAQFQNLKTSIGGHAEMHLFDGAPAANVSGQWDPVQTGGAQVKFSIDSSQSYNSGRSQCVEFVSGKGTAGVANQGLNRWGVAVKKGTTYVGRVYLRATGLHGEVTVSLQSLDGAKVYASQALSGVTGAWAKFPYTLVSNADDGLARFVISINSPGTLWIDQAVLMEPPTGRFQGLPVREDIANAMVAGKLSFLRYGGTAVNAPEYRWKKMTGDPDRRAQYQGHWHPYTSNGFGMIEFVAFCERAGIQAAFAINVEETPQDMADMIEYLNGDATSPCGSARAADGHPKPYGVKYIEIGNEEVIWGDVAADYDHYVQRFKLLAAAMRQKDPNLIFINAAWWRGNNTNCERVFKALDGEATYWDFHPWADPAAAGKEVDTMLTEARRLFQQWLPGAKMKVVIFEENGNLHNQQRALGHATTLNAVRRHGDFVAIDCEANGLQPWLQNDNGWDQGHIFFTAGQVWGMPPYYAQQMASANHQPLVVASQVLDGANLDVSSTMSADGRTLCLHVVNLAASPTSARLVLDRFPGVNPVASLSTLAGTPDAANGLIDPTKIQPVMHELANASGDFNQEFPAYSYTVVRLSR